MKVEFQNDDDEDFDEDFVEVEISKGERGGVDREDTVYVLLEMGDGAVEGYVSVDLFNKIAQAFQSASNELSAP